MLRWMILVSVLCCRAVLLPAQVNLRTAHSYPVGNEPRNLAAADLNGDGQADVVTANSNDTTITVLLNNGQGTIRSGGTYTVGAFPNDVVVGDFNGDGKPDLAVSPCGASGTTLGLRPAWKRRWNFSIARKLFDQCCSDRSHGRGLQ